MTAAPYLTIAEAAELARVSPKRLRNLMGSGVLREGVHYSRPRGLRPRFKRDGTPWWRGSKAKARRSSRRREGAKGRRRSAALSRSSLKSSHHARVLGSSSSSGVNLKWLAEYCGNSVEMIERHFGRFMLSGEEAQLRLLMGASAVVEPGRKRAAGGAKSATVAPVRAPFDLSRLSC